MAHRRGDDRGGEGGAGHVADTRHEAEEGVQAEAKGRTPQADAVIKQGGGSAKMSQHRWGVSVVGQGRSPTLSRRARR